MYEIVKNVIEGGSYELSGLLHKIDTLWAQGDLTDDQRDGLKSLARSGASAKEGVDLFAKLQELEARVKALEAGKQEGGAEAAAEDFQEGRWYYNGDKCIWNGETYTCTAPAGVVCVWSPAAYPAYWTKEA